MLKMRAQQRKQFGAGGPSSVQEREEARKRDRERVKEEMRLFKIQAFKEMKRKEMEDMKKNGWMVLAYDENFNVDAEVHVIDLAESLEGNDKEKFEKALLLLKEKEDLKARNADNSKDNDPPANSNVSKPSSEEVSKEKKDGNESKPVKKEIDDGDFQKYFAIFANPELTDKEEVGYLKQLIGEKKSALVKQLVLELASVPGAGKSNIFKSLAKKYEMLKSQKESVVKKEVKEEKTKLPLKEDIDGSKLDVKGDQVKKEDVKGDHIKKEDVESSGSKVTVNGVSDTLKDTVNLKKENASDIKENSTVEEFLSKKENGKKEGKE